MQYNIKQIPAFGQGLEEVDELYPSQKLGI
jgi:hypothetical protein